MMDILFLCQFFYPEQVSSAVLPFDTAKHLSAAGYSVDVMCGYPREYYYKKQVKFNENIAGVGVHRIRYIHMSRRKKIGRLINYFSFTMSAFLRLYKFRQYHCVIVYSNPPILPYIATLAHMLFRTKIIFVSYDVYPEIAVASGKIKLGSLIYRSMNLINKAMYKRVSSIIALTDEMKYFLLNNRVGLSREKVVTIPNWAHEQITVKDRKFYEYFGYNESQFIVSYLGNMGVCQEMETLISAIEMMKDNKAVQFLMIGHGSKECGIKQFFSDRNLNNVQMHSFFTGDEFEQVIAISSCYIISLEKGLKGMCAPSKFYSYLQGGKPVIFIGEADSYLHKEINEESIGYCINIGDTVGLVESIEYMRMNMSQTIEMGERSRKLYSRKYEKSISMDKYTSLVNNVLGKVEIIVD